jgi:pimeloyl-ACP methyl ester carboxylesterase
MMPADTRKASADMRLYSDDAGSGPEVVVFLHSLAGRGEQWRHQLNHVRRTSRAVALDWRGHGNSPRPENLDFDVGIMADDVLSTLQEIDVHQFVLVGHSAGAAVALGCIEQAPDRVAGLFLLDPVGDMRGALEDDLRPFLDALFGDQYTQVIEAYWEQILQGAEPATRHQVMEDLWATPRDTVMGVFQALATFDPVGAISGYGGPILDVITPLNNSPSSLHNLLPELRVRLIPGVSHWPQLDRPQEINHLLDVLLRSMGRSGIPLR